MGDDQVARTADCPVCTGRPYPCATGPQPLAMALLAHPVHAKRSISQTNRACFKRRAYRFMSWPTRLGSIHYGPTCSWMTLSKSPTLGGLWVSLAAEAPRTVRSAAACVV